MSHKHFECFCFLVQGLFCLNLCVILDYFSFKMHSRQERSNLASIVSLRKLRGFLSIKWYDV